ncbi:hypothetical protein CRG98_017808, partial [Punica granatum]
SSHGLAEPARLQEARARWLGELAVQESKLARVSRPGKVARKTRPGCKRHERGGSTNLRCRKVSSHGLADPARLQKSKLARVSRPGKFARKVGSHGLADPARLQEARARWLGELSVQESKLARVSRLGKVVEKKVSSHGLADPARLQEAQARSLGEPAVKEISSHGLADQARLQEARARWLGELAVQESKLARSRQGYKRHERGGSANLRCRKVSSNELEDPAWLQKSKLARVSRTGKVARGTSEVARRTCRAGKLADPTRLQEARARWLGELAVQESKLARVSRPSKESKLARASRPGKIARKVSSHGLAEPARLQEERPRCLSELAVLESKLARISRPGKAVEK